MDMAELSRSDSKRQSPGFTPKPPGGRHRIISSCLTCRRRKVKCDHAHPVCGACARGGHTCTYGPDQMTGVSVSPGGRVSKPGYATDGRNSKNTDVQTRLDRLELLLGEAVLGQPLSRQQSRPVSPQDDPGHESDVPHSAASQTSQGAISSDNNNGTLLLDNGQSKFVSSMHWALLAEEVQDIKALLADETDVNEDIPTQNNLIHYLGLGRAKIGVRLKRLSPDTQEKSEALLEIYFSNIDPVLRVTHGPTLRKKLSTYCHECHPLAFAIYFSAINSLPPAVVESRFGELKTDLIAKYEMGLEVSLARANYLTSPSLEILQAFVIWLTCITREDDIGKAWALLGVGIRIALNQGLHRDPSLFPAGTFDTITVEIRRRLWHQICSLEFRAAEAKGQEPSIAEDDYTTLLPRNIEDEDLQEEEISGVTKPNEEGWTSMTYQLIRFNGTRAERRMIKSTYRLERRMLESSLRGTSIPDAAVELQSIYSEVVKTIAEVNEETYRKYIRFANRDVLIHRMALGLASLLQWRCFVLFWLRMPRAFREMVFPLDVRISIFEKSVNMIETLNGATADPEAGRFQWHIGAHAVFQAIMHVLSELRNTLFDAPNRIRAIQALRFSRMLKEQDQTKPWQAVKSMIDRLLGDQSNSLSSPSDHSPITGQHPPELQNSMPLNLPTYPQPVSSYTRIGSSQPPMTHALEAQPHIFSQLQTTQQPNFYWSDIDFDNMVGDMQTDTQPPQFDFVRSGRPYNDSSNSVQGFWGDPIHFGNQPVNCPTNMQYTATWPS